LPGERIDARPAAWRADDGCGGGATIGPVNPAAACHIRRAVPADAPAIARVNSEPAVMASLLQLPFPNVEALRQRLTEQDQPGRSDLQLVADLGGTIVASAGLHPASAQLRRRHVMGLGIAVATSAQGQGVGTALMQALIDYADHWGQVLRLELTVFTDNERALRLYQRFGFRLEGTHHAYALRDGMFADVHSMARLHPRPPVAAWPAA
jgi:putative acetyltransferase